MASDADEPLPPPMRPAAAARPKRHVLLTMHHSPDAPLAPNAQKVLLELKGVSSAASRAPLDLVAVIDVSGSMEGDKLESVKKALLFVIHKLTDQDRISIVKFDHEATRLCPLLPVTEASRARLEGLVGDLKTRGSTDIRAGLQTGLDVVANRKITAGRAASIMLMSDGRQIEDGDPRQFEPGNVAVHTYGFGADHDHDVMTAIAERSLDGVYNSVPDSDNPKELAVAFAPILGGLTTIVAQDMELTVTAIQGEATIKKVDAGTYRLRTSSDISSSVTISFGNLYSAEVRKVMVELALSDRTASQSYRASVAEVQYRFAFQGQEVTSRPQRIIIYRRRRASADPANAPLPVQTEVARLEHVASIKEAVAKADGGKLEDARNTLRAALEALRRIVDPVVDMLRRELRKLLELFETEETYRNQGRSAALSSISSHGRQRGGPDKDTLIFGTPRMITNLEQAKQRDDMPVPSADQDAQLELEERPGWLQDVLPVALRLLAAVLSLLAFSIIASARTSGWDGEYYGRYEPYRYAVAVNVIVCFYSIAQVFVRIRRSVSPQLRSTSCYRVTLFLDQVLAYLLMSASSAAASSNHLWVSRFGEDPFHAKITAAVWFSFLAFLALSANALISTANLFSRI
ncbi:unnamed protein product [Urochloa decumbens]|uniref:VWFA domain-containing protein n=1 Tax=Urochloa decumbens TaxID=240449 RepID=A0ABC9AV03_9POAL